MKVLLKFTALIALMLIASCASATVYYVTNSGIDLRDGLSWGNSKATIQAAINAASAGDQVWVKGGTYVENLTLKSGVALYGGFQGTEASLTERPAFPRTKPDANETVIDGNKANCVIIAVDAASTTRVDGFTIQNGDAASNFGWETCGGGIYIDGGSPVITNNIITDNLASWYSYSGYSWGGGIYCLNSEASIFNNLICFNEATNGGAGIGCDGGSPAIYNNMIVNNHEMSTYASGGIACINESAPVIFNNTIACNGGAGVYSTYYSTPVLVNNIIAFNYKGIDQTPDSGVIALNNNCVYGNTNANYAGLSAGTGDISSDPLFASVKWGNYHIQANSPCRNVGDSSVVDVSWRDMDGQTRIQGTTVDMGADESDGTTWNVTPKVVRVSTEGNDTYNGGESWSYPVRTIQNAINILGKNGGGEVWVQGGTYNECLTLARRVYLYGGFVGGWNTPETLLSNRNPKRNITIIDAGQNGTAVLYDKKDKLAGCVDGFTITNGQGSPRQYDYYGGGIYSIGGLIIKNNIITDNHTDGYNGGGIACGGVPEITNNVVCNNSCVNYGAGIYCLGYNGGVVADNLIYNNTCTALYSYGGGIYSTMDMLVANNTIVGNTAYYGGGIENGSGGTIANNIVAFNSSGISTGYGTLINNCVYGNTNGDYNYGDPGPTDINVDPLFVDSANGNYHLQPTSPCVNAGDNSSILSGWLDMDLDARISADGLNIVDMGADELYRKIATLEFSPDGGPYASAQTVTITCGTPGVSIHYTTNGAEPTTSDAVYSTPLTITGCTILKAKAFLNTWVASDTKMAQYKIAGSYTIVRVDGVNGNDANNGSTWTLAKKTITSATAAVTAGDEIWVKGGTYNWKGMVPANTGFYGGFAGTETLRSQRDWVRNPTTLDAGGYMTIMDTNGTSEIDGFTIKNGSYYVGAGIIANGSPLIIHNRFESNHASYLGGAIACSNGSPRIVSNIFYDNRADNWGGAIYCGSGSPIITNNTFRLNYATEGAAVYVGSSASATICNNLCYMSPDTFYGQEGANAYLRSNYIYIFTYMPGYAYSGVEPGIDDYVSWSDNGTFASWDDPNAGIGYNPEVWDAGWDDAPGIPATDIDGQARRFGRVDIGANEKYAVRVSDNLGDDDNDGSSWADAKQTIQAALGVDKAPVEVWVEAGTYNERINMAPGYHLLGGFDGTELSGYTSDRDWSNNSCIIDGGGNGSTVTISGSDSLYTAQISGFTIRNGYATDGGGIYCTGSPYIDHNRIEGNYGGDFGGGIRCDFGSPVIVHNLILGNEAGQGGGIYCGNYCSPAIVYNTIANYNVAYMDGGAIYISGTASPTIGCNIIYQNANSVYAETGATPTLERNLIWAGSGLGYSYSGLNPGTGDITNQNPLFRGANDYRLQSTSPCIDAGPDWDYYYYTYGEPAFIDYLGIVRNADGNGDGVYMSDMGAYEYIP